MSKGIINSIKCKFGCMLIAMMVLASWNAFSQSPNWLWANSAGGNRGEDATSTVTDASGNVYVTGYFYSQEIIIGNDTLRNSNLAGMDFFIAKYDSLGNPLWSERAGEIFDDAGQSIAVDDNGNVYVLGYSNNASITFGSTTLINSGNTDVFIVKYDGNGNVLWAKNFGGSGDDFGKGIVVVNSNIYITGHFGSLSIIFGNDTMSNSMTDGSNDIFIVKYNSSGDVIWDKSFGGASGDVANGIATNDSGFVYLTGYFLSPVISFDGSSLNNAGIKDVFLVKIDSNGSALWATSAFNGGNDEAYSIAADENGNTYLTGFFAGSSILFGSVNLPGAGFENIFVVKYDPAGNAIWARSGEGLGSNNFDAGYSIGTDYNGDIFVTGGFSSTSIVFGNDTLSKSDLGTTSDIFICKYAPSGDVVWSKRAGGNDDDIALHISLGQSGSIYLAGHFFSSFVTFGGSTLINTGASFDMFVAKLDTTVTTGMPIVYTDRSILLWPNPASDELRVWSPEQDVQRTELYDVSGKKILERTPVSKNHEQVIDISHLATGLYFVKVYTTKGMATMKVVIN